jgi:glycosyltransferase involved in cell wall biosynthesis
MPKLSVITINFNNKDGLEKTIRSVIAQTFTDYEYIVIDGGSTDGSVDIIKKYASAITYSVSEKDNGIYNAQNKGIKAAKGEYCLFLNSGDFLVNEKVLKNVFSKNYSEDILYGNMMIDYGNKKVTLGKMPAVISLYQMYTDTLWHPVSFIRKQLFEKYGNYDERYKIVADYEFFFRNIIANKVTTRHTGSTISQFSIDGLSSKPENKLQEQGERKSVQKKYLTEKEIADLDQQKKVETLKKGKLLNRIINKLNR